MKVAVVGCGAVGSFYGARLARAGHETHFLLRSDYDAVRRHGVEIRSFQGDFRARPRCARTAEEIGPADLVIVALKSTANHILPALIPPLLKEGGAVVTLQNGLGNEETLAAVVPRGQILGGLCFVCLNRIEPGVIQHIAHGQIVLGEFDRWPEPRTHDIAGSFRAAGVPCKVSSNLAQAHWEKLVWNIPFNGLGVAACAGLDAVAAGEAPENSDRLPCLTTQDLLSDARWTTLVRELMLEVITAARNLGFNIPEGLADKQIERTRGMGEYKASTLIDFERGQPLELHTLFLEPLRRAKAAGAAMPRLEGLCKILTFLDASREDARPCR